MLRITADVNGRIIGYLFIHNSGKVTVQGEHLYNAAIWQHATDPARLPEQDGILGFEGIPHSRPDGWAKLVWQVLRRQFGD